MSRLSVLILALAALPASALPASAQSLALTPAPPSMRTLTVTGDGEASALADYAVIRFEVATKGATLDEALALHAAEVARVEGLLRAAGVLEANVTLDRVAVGDGSDGEDGPSFGGDGATETVTVSRAITAEVDDLDAVDGLVGSLASRRGDDALTTQMRSVVVSFERRDVAALRETALRAAVQNARRRADLAAEAAGVRVGRVLSITEAGVTGALFGVPGGGAAAERLALMMLGGGGGGSGERTEASRVVVVYEAE